MDILRRSFKNYTWHDFIIAPFLAALLYYGIDYADAQSANGKVTTAAPTYSNGATSPLSLDLAGNLRTLSGSSGATADQVQGNSASGAADVGNPVKSGAVFNTTPGTVTTGQRVDNQADAQGNLRARIISGAGSTGADGVANTALLEIFANNSQAAVLRPIAAGDFIFNGTTWDRLRGTGGAVNVNTVASITAALPAGSNNIGDFGDAQNAATAGQIGPLVQGAVTTNPPTYTTANSNPISLDTAGNQRVILGAVTSTAVVTATVAATPIVIKASAGLLYGINMTNVAAQLIVYDNASACSGTQRFAMQGAITNTTVFEFAEPLTFTTGITFCTSAIAAVGYRFQ